MWRLSLLIHLETGQENRERTRMEQKERQNCAHEWAQVPLKVGQVAQDVTHVTLLPTPASGSFPYRRRTQGGSTLARSCMLLSTAGESLSWQCAMCLCFWQGRVRLCLGLCPRGDLPSQHSPVQGKELAVAVERHITQVENLQPCEVPHVREVAHFVALQVETSDLRTKTSEGTRGNLQ